MGEREVGEGLGGMSGEKGNCSWDITYERRINIKIKC